MKNIFITPSIWTILLLVFISIPIFCIYSYLGIGLLEDFLYPSQKEVQEIATKSALEFCKQKY